MQQCVQWENSRVPVRIAIFKLRKFNFVVVFHTFWTQPAQKTRNAWCVAPDAASFIKLSTHYFTCYFSFWHFSNKQKQRMRKDSLYLLMKRKRQSAVSFTFIIQLACVRTGSLFFLLEIIHQWIITITFFFLCCNDPVTPSSMQL